MILFLSRGNPGYGHTIPQLMLIEKYPSIAPSVVWLSYGPAAQFLRKKGVVVQDIPVPISGRQFWFPGLDVFDWVEILQGYDTSRIDCILSDGELNAAIAGTIVGIPTLLILSTNYFHPGLSPYWDFSAYFRYVSGAATKLAVYGLAEKSDLMDLPPCSQLFGPIARRFAPDGTERSDKIRVLVALGHVPATGPISEELRHVASKAVQTLADDDSVRITIAAENLEAFDELSDAEISTPVDLAIDHASFDLILGRPGLNLVCEALLRTSKIRVLKLSSTDEYRFLTERIERFGLQPVELDDCKDRILSRDLILTDRVEDDTEPFLDSLMDFCTDPSLAGRSEP